MSSSSTMRCQYLRGAGSSAVAAQAHGHYIQGPKALPPGGTGGVAMNRARALRPGRTWEMTAMMFWYGSHWPFWEAGLMWVGMIAFWGLLIWGIYALISSATRKPDHTRRDGGALSILDQRLARGESESGESRRGPD